MKYRKKPIVIEAIQYLGPSSYDEMIEEWGQAFANKSCLMPGYLNIRTLEGAHIAKISDYIIKGIEGEFYNCKESIFLATYEKVDE